MHYGYVRIFWSTLCVLGCLLGIPNISLSPAPLFAATPDDSTVVSPTTHGTCQLRSAQITVYELDGATDELTVPATSAHQISSVGIVIDDSDEIATITVNEQPMSAKISGRQGVLYGIDFAQVRDSVTISTTNVFNIWRVVIVEGTAALRWPGKSLSGAGNDGFVPSHVEDFVTPFTGILDACIVNVDNDIDGRSLTYALQADNVSAASRASLTSNGGTVGSSDVISLSIKSQTGLSATVTASSPPAPKGDTSFLTLVALASRVDPSADTDGDHVLDGVEDGNGDSDPTNDDTDGDAIPDFEDGDDDGDGVNTADEDLDRNGDPGNDNTDADPLPNYRDADDDGDSVPSKEEDGNNNQDLRDDDSDQDSVANFLDADDDGDNVPTLAEDVDGNGDPRNDNNDGDSHPNFLDNDDEGDGVPTLAEDVNADDDPANDDIDNDDLANFLDNDDDNDGFFTKEEDRNQDGDNNPASNPSDRDADKIPDYLDRDDGGPGTGDSDDDAVLDNQEDADGDGSPINDDSDQDGQPNYMDDDDDNDQKLTRAEDRNRDGDPTNDDSDGDKLPDFLDSVDGRSTAGEKVYLPVIGKK